MTDRPILFSGPMVRATLDGRKTQTRRVLRNQPPTVEAVHALAGTGYHWLANDDGSWRPVGPVWAVRQLMKVARPRLLPPYQPGDRLWVKEAWRTHAQFDHLKPREITTTSIHYEADGSVRSGRYRHARFMPRRISRLTLYVTAVKVERLQEISEEDAKEEGAEEWWKGLSISARDGLISHRPEFIFSRLWDSINGKREGCRWDDNPWVVAPTFTAHQGNIDSLPLELAA